MHIEFVIEKCVNRCRFFPDEKSLHKVILKEGDSSVYMIIFSFQSQFFVSPLVVVNQCKF